MKVDELRMLATKTERKVIVHHFTPAELIERRKNVTDLSVEIMEENDRYAPIKAEHSEMIKGLAADLQLATREVRRGFVEKDTECYLIPDQDRGVMNYTVEGGEVVYTRPLYPEERQLSLLNKAEG